MCRCDTYVVFKGVAVMDGHAHPCSIVKGKNAPINSDRGNSLSVQKIIE